MQLDHQFCKNEFTILDILGPPYILDIIIRFTAIEQVHFITFGQQLPVLLEPLSMI